MQVFTLNSSVLKEQGPLSVLDVVRNKKETAGSLSQFSGTAIRLCTYMYAMTRNFIFHLPIQVNF